MFYFNFLKEVDGYRFYASFNPYFTGCSTSTLTHDSISIYFYKFQSLFYWMFYFNIYWHTAWRHWFWVSILILLDVLLQPYIYMYVVGIATCFNPYFTGCSTSTSPKEYHLQFVIMVSILILLDVLLQPMGAISIKNLSWAFQSLFYWMFYFNYTSTKKADFTKSLFQSLFYWMFYFNHFPISNSALFACCFNPYFTGCSTSTTGNSYTIATIGKFQSLFYWMFYFNDCWHQGIWDTGVVSILILLDVLLQQERIRGAPAVNS